MARWLKDIGRRMRAARERAGLSQADVAKNLGLTTEGYGHFERGNRVIGFEYFLQLPAILRVPVTDLLPDALVTAEDRQRAKDPQLQDIIDAWSAGQLTDDAKAVLLSSFDTLLKLSRQGKA